METKVIGNLRGDLKSPSQKHYPAEKPHMRNATKKKDYRVFFIGFWTTLCISFFIIGVLTVDYHGRRMSINDSSPVVAVVKEEDGTAVMQVNALGYEQEYTVTSIVELWEKIKDFCCLPK